MIWPWWDALLQKMTPPATTPWLPPIEPIPKLPAPPAPWPAATLDGLTEAVVRTCLPANPNPVAVRDALAAGCAMFKVRGPLPIAALLAQVGHESGDLLALDGENMNYRVEALLDKFPSHMTPQLAARLGRVERLVNGRRVIIQAADQRAIAEQVYGGQYGNGPPGSGDGWAFRGHGGIQVTFRGPWADCGKTLGMTAEQAVEYSRTLAGAAMTACWYFSTRTGLLAAAQAGDFARVCLLTGGGRKKMDAAYDALIQYSADRLPRYRTARKALGVPL